MRQAAFFIIDPKIALVNITDRFQSANNSIKHCVILDDYINVNDRFGRHSLH